MSHISRKLNSIAWQWPYFLYIYIYIDIVNRCAATTPSFRCFVCLYHHPIIFFFFCCTNQRYKPRHSIVLKFILYLHLLMFVCRLVRALGFFFFGVPISYSHSRWTHRPSSKYVARALRARYILSRARIHHTLQPKF